MSADVLQIPPHSPMRKVVSYLTKLNIMYKLIASLLLISSVSYGQSSAEKLTKRLKDWWQADWKKDSLPGISLDEAYSYLRKKIKNSYRC